MNEEKLKQAVAEFKSSNDDWNPDGDQLLDLISPGLRESKTPTTEQLALVGKALGWLRDGGCWWKSASGGEIAEAIAKGCKLGLTVVQALDLIETGIGVGASEFGG